MKTVVNSTQNQHVFEVLGVFFVGNEAELINTEFKVEFFLPESDHFFSFGDDDKVVENVEFAGKVEWIGGHLGFELGGVGDGLAVEDFEFVLEVFVLLLGEGVVAFLADLDEEFFGAFEGREVGVFGGQFF